MQNLDPDLLLAHQYEQENRLTLAGTHYIRALRANPMLEDGYLGLARVFFAQEKFEECSFVLKQGFLKTRSSPKLLEFRKTLAKTCLASNILTDGQKFDLCLNWCRQGWSEEEAVRTLIRLAAPLQRKGEAILIMEEVASRDPERRLSLLKAAASLALQAENIKKARELALQVLKESISDPEATRLLQLAKIKNGPTL